MLDRIVIEGDRSELQHTKCNRTRQKSGAIINETCECRQQIEEVNEIGNSRNTVGRQRSPNEVQMAQAEITNYRGELTARRSVSFEN